MPRHFKPMGRVESVVLSVQNVEWEVVYQAANGAVLSWNPKAKKAERLSWAAQTAGDIEDNETTGEDGETEDNTGSDDGSDTETEF